MLKKIILAASLTLLITPQVQATNFDELQAYLLELLSFNDSKDDEPAAKVPTLNQAQSESPDTTEKALEGEPEWEAN